MDTLNSFGVSLSIDASLLTSQTLVIVQTINLDVAPKHGLNVALKHSLDAAPKHGLNVASHTT